jgi:hypothetical protein
MPPLLLKIGGKSAAGLVFLYGASVVMFSLTVDFQRETNTINGSITAKAIYIVNANLNRDFRSKHGLYRDVFLTKMLPCWTPNFPGCFLQAMKEKSLPALDLLKWTFIRAPPVACSTLFDLLYR